MKPKHFVGQSAYFSADIRQSTKELQEVIHIAWASTFLGGRFHGCLMLIPKEAQPTPSKDQCTDWWFKAQCLALPIPNFAVKYLFRSFCNVWRLFVCSFEATVRGNRRMKIGEFCRRILAASFAHASRQLRLNFALGASTHNILRRYILARQDHICISSPMKSAFQLALLPKFTSLLNRTCRWRVQ